MTVLSTNRISSGIGLGVVGLGTVAVVLLLRHRSSKRKHCDKGSVDAQGDSTISPKQPALPDNEPKLKSRFNGFKISKLKRLIGAMAEADDVELEAEVDFNWDKAAAGQAQTEGASAEHAIDTNDETEWEKLVASEHRTFLLAAQTLHDLRGSSTHKKLPHFYVVDRQLSQMEEQFREISEHVLEFPWRDHRDDPISDLMKLPFMTLMADGGQQSLLPVSQGFVKQIESKPDVKEAKDISADEEKAEDERLLGIDATCDREALESAFRFGARELHAHGQCIKIDAFHKLNNAYDRCRARLTNTGWKDAYRGGSNDILAHYLLIGTDPSESRYGEAVSGLLDALKRERLLTRLDVLRSWGEVSGTATGLGNG